jgi:hypothetical protein
MSKLLHSGNLIIAGFILAAVSMLYLAYLTTTVHFDLSTQGDYYTAETQVNDEIKAKKQSSLLGNDFLVKENEDGIIISLPPRISSKIQSGKVDFYCYSDSKNDKQAILEANAEGIFSFAKNEYMPGHNYNVKISFVADGIDYYKEVRIY